MHLRPLLIALMGTSLLLSCNDDDEPTPPHEIGTWTLGNYQTINVPAAYANGDEGEIYDIDEITLGSVIVESYTLVVNVDGTFERIVAVTGASTVENTGTWELQDDVLAMDARDIRLSWKIIRNEEDQLWLSQSNSFLLLPDVIQDTITQEYIDSIPGEEYFELLDIVLVDLVYAFDRE